MSVHICGDGQARSTARATINRYVCPGCDGTGRDPGDGGRCYRCAGTQLVDDVHDPGPGHPDRPVKLPRPPAVMKASCVDCAYRLGSPEDVPDSGRPDDAGTPFFCHHGMHRLENEAGEVGYAPAAWAGGLPLGYMVCAGWWDHIVEGGPAPVRPFRDPGGSDRGETSERAR